MAKTSKPGGKSGGKPGAKPAGGWLPSLLGAALLRRRRP